MRHALQAAFGFAAQVGVTFDGGQQLVGGVDPQAQFVLLVALEHRQLVFAGTVRVDVAQVLDDFRQRLGQQPLIDQIQHQAHGQGAEHAGNEDHHRAGDEVLAVRSGVEGDVEVAVIFLVRPAADQRNAEGLLFAEDYVGEQAALDIQQGAGFFRQYRLVRMTDGGVAHRVILEQAFDHLQAHFPVQAVDRLGRGIAEHGQDALGIIGYGLTGLIDVKDDLRAA